MTSQSPSIFDICIIGCGAAGFAAAMRAVDFQQSVCLIENGPIGGAAVMKGALASKTLWELAKDYYVAARPNRGYRAHQLQVDYRAVRKTVFEAVQDKQRQMRRQIACFASAPPRPGSICFKRGRAAFVSPHTIEIVDHFQGRETIQVRNTLVATGSRPRHLAGITVDQKRVFDSDGILRLTSFPRRLLIVGAGVIGCEFASIFACYGQTQVYLVDHAARILPWEDDDVAGFVSRNLLQHGVTIFQFARLSHIDEHTDHLEAHLTIDGCSRQVVAVDAVLIAVGRQPQLHALRLERAGLTPDEQGFLPVDRNCRAAPHLYAAGDVCRHPALVNIAETEARYAVKHICGRQRWPLRVHNVSTIMFFQPAVAAVGLNEKDCRQQQIPYRVAFYANALLSRALAMRAPDGFVKIIIGDTPEAPILGMRAAGPEASSMIMAIALLMDQDKGLHDVLKTVHPHPAMSEGIQECLRVLQHKSIYKPQAFPDLIRINHWRPEA